MTLEQAIAFAIVIAMMVMFVWGRLRYDLVALLGLLAAVASGIVPPERAFRGFSDDIVIIIATALLVSAAVGRSGVIDTVLRQIGPSLTTTRSQVAVLTAAVTAMSGFVKNIGALSMLIPVAFQVARRTGSPPSYLLMPLAFGSLLGGITTLIGTSPNIIVSQMRERLIGEPFRMFDFMPVGAALAAAGVVFLTFGYRLLPVRRKAAASVDAAFNLEDYTTEVLIPEGSPTVGKTVGDLEAMSEGDVEVLTIIRERYRRFTPSQGWTLQQGDILLLEGEPAAVERLVGQAKLELATSADTPEAEEASREDATVVEAVVMGDSPLVDRSPVQMRLSDRFQLQLLAVSRSGERVSQRLRSVRFRAGDVLVLRGSEANIFERLGELRCLPLATRDIRLGRGRQGLLPVLVLATAMTLAALQIVPVAVAFFGAAVIVVLVGSLTLREAYEAIDWPILILIGALIPVSEAIRTTGGAELIAGWLAATGQGLPALGTIALLLMAAMAVTPFLNNAATVLIMAPIAVSLAVRLGFDPDPFLMAVAIGAACDFLSPIGHQSNTLVWGPGGYRFTDYWRLGLPLSALVIVAGVPLIAHVWPPTG